MSVANQYGIERQKLKKNQKSSFIQNNQIKTPTALIQNGNKYSIPSISSQKFHNEQSTAGSLQNGQITQFYFQKLIHIQYQLCLVVFLNMFLIIISSSISFPQLKQHDNMTQKGCLYFCLVCFIVQCLLLGFRTVTVLELQKQQKILYQKSTIFSSKKIFYYLAQCFIMMIQPYPFFQSIKILTSNSYDLTQFQLPLNDLLTVISVLRVYVFIRAGLILTPYQNTRSNRLCKMYGCKADFSFSLKCMFKDNPLILIGVFFTISSMIFAFQMYLVQRRAADLEIDPRGMCNNYPNALWLVLMTITTVGYGDYFPHTSIGRIMILIVAIWGTFIVSMMVVVVSNTLTMQKNQKRTSIIINKLEMRKQIQKQAQKLVGYFILKKRQQKKIKQIQKRIKLIQDEDEIYKLENKKEGIQKIYKKYSYLVNNLQKSFSKLRKQIKNSQDVEDIQDEVSSHFLHVNSDIQILNKNQQKIIKYNGKNKKQKQNKKYEDDKDDEDDKDNEDDQNDKDDDQNDKQKQLNQTHKYKQKDTQNQFIHNDQSSDQEANHQLINYKKQSAQHQ